MASDENKKPEQKFTKEAWLWWTPVALFALTLFIPWGYGYYTLLRLVVTGCCILIAYLAWKDGPIWGPVFAFMAVLFNPIIQVSFEREVWLLIDLIATGIFVYHRREYVRKLKDET